MSMPWLMVTRGSTCMAETCRSGLKVGSVWGMVKMNRICQAAQFSLKCGTSVQKHSASRPPLSLSLHVRISTASAEGSQSDYACSHQPCSQRASAVDYGGYPEVVSCALWNPILLSFPRSWSCCWNTLQVYSVEHSRCPRSRAVSPPLDIGHLPLVLPTLAYALSLCSCVPWCLTVVYSAACSSTSRSLPQTPKNAFICFLTWWWCAFKKRYIFIIFFNFDQYFICIHRFRILKLKY